MEFDHGLDQGQSKPGPFVTALQMVLQLDERLHDPVDILRSYPDAGIADPHLQPAGGIMGEGDGDPPAGSRQRLVDEASDHALHNPDFVMPGLSARCRPVAVDGPLVEAARARASVGEISMAMEKVFGRHRAEVRTLAGVYGAAYEGDEGFARIQKDVEAFAEEEAEASGDGKQALGERSPASQ